MRLTPVGPLPAAVYWRRRFAVLGALAALILLTVYACGGFDDDDNGTPTAKEKPSSPAPLPIETQTPPDGGAGNSASASPNAPSDGGNPDAGEPDSAQPDPGQQLPPAPPPDQVAECTDDALLLTATPVKPKYPAGAYVRLNLVIKNVSNQPCKRDLGADQQELRLMLGEQRFWSSDDCKPAHGSRVVVLRASESFRFWVVWDGKSSQPGCKGTRTFAKPGTYHVVGRLANKLSPPTAVTLT